jgi:hypothetical protein
VNYRHWGRGVLAAVGLTAGCRLGSFDVPIGTDRQSIFYVAPDGDDQNPGTRELPWKTLERATTALLPGQTLELLNGDYRLETTGLLKVDCAGPPNRGRPESPITVRAETERGAVLHGDGAAPPLELWSCSHWVIEGLVLTNEHSPNDEHVRFPVTAADDDACVAYLGRGSLLRTAVGADGDVGANTINRYQDGTLTNVPLWDPRIGGFTCGAVVPGVNDDPSQSCIGVHERFRVGSAGCALPIETL